MQRAAARQDQTKTAQTRMATVFVDTVAPKVRAVLWTVYGTLLSIPPHGELLFQHPQDFVQEMALEKTISEFKMWGSMSRKPGQPADYMREIYRKAV